MHPFNPAIDLILQSGFLLFTKVSVMMLGLIGTIFLMRVIALQARFAHAQDYAGLLKDVVLYFSMIQLFPILVRIIYSTGAGLATKISFVPVTVAQSKLDEFFSSMFFDFQILKITAKIGDFVILNLAQGFYFTTIISISLWPVVWNLIGLFGKELFNSTSSSTLTIIIYWFLIQILQLLSPLFCLFLLKSLSPSGVVTKIIGMGTKIGGKL